MITRIRKTVAALAVLALVTAGSHAASAQGTGDGQSSLYERLGGLDAISVVISDLIDALVTDDVLNENPAIAASRGSVSGPYLKYQVTSMVCDVSGGPCEYTGRSMHESHAHLNITEAEWDRMITVLEDVLAKHEVPAAETRELLDIVESTKADIVASGSEHPEHAEHPKGSEHPNSDHPK